MSWPVLEGDPVVLPTLPGHDDELWAALVEVSGLRPGEWTVVIVASRPLWPPKGWGSGQI